VCLFFKIIWNAHDVLIIIIIIIIIFIIIIIITIFKPPSGIDTES